MALNPYEMKLHEHRAIDANNSVLRVPGGWVYTTFIEGYPGDYREQSFFVPFDNEFMNK